MADNLSVSVTADTSDLRAKLALAQADLRAFGAETRTLANSIRAGGDAGGVLRGQLEQIVGSAAAAKSNVISLTGALRDHTAAHEEAAAGIEGVNEALTGLTAPLTGAVGGFKEMAEVLGVAFAVEKIADFCQGDGRARRAHLEPQRHGRHDAGEILGSLGRPGPGRRQRRDRLAHLGASRPQFFDGDRQSGE
jgi:hypothetical protein